MNALVQDIEAFEESLGRRLIGSGKLDEGGLNRAKRLLKPGQARLPALLSKLGLVSEHDLAVAMAEEIGSPLVTAADLPADPILPERLKLRFLRQMQVLPLEEGPEGIVLAVSNPLDRFAIEAVRVAVDKKPMLRIAEPGLIERAFEELYGREGGDGAIGEAGAEPARDLEFDVERLKDMASEAPVVRLVNGLITKAVESHASDVHIEPFEGRVVVRYRIDGILVEVDGPPPSLIPAVISRIKIMSNLNIAERRLPQDGRIQMVVRGKVIDLRVSTMPTLDGESVVLRILDRDSVALDFASLGMAGPNLERLETMLSHPNGVLLVTGPTGSGKTTTLYAALTRLNSPEKKILTVEDPIEYRLSGINQVQVKPGIGLSFAHVLRAMLRQDPDIIMVGEIRDGETAEIAVQAALTGHLVLSTLHTNDAASAITRLMDMGVQDFLLTSTLTGVVAQRLVRRLCGNCREKVEVIAQVIEQLGLERFQRDGDIVLYQPKGCDQCGGRGYSGRTSIVEVLTMTDDLRHLMLQGAGARELSQAASDGGMTTMFDDGVAKAMAGTTTLEEVLRVTREV
jgi:general secretion pathway protein E